MSEALRRECARRRVCLQCRVDPAFRAARALPERCPFGMEAHFGIPAPAATARGARDSEPADGDESLVRELEEDRGELCRAAGCGQLVGRIVGRHEGCALLDGGKPCALAWRRRDPAGQCPLGLWPASSSRRV